MCDSSAEFYQNAESKADGEDTGLHQEIDELHHRHGDAGDSSASMPNIPPTILAQKTDAGGPAIEGLRGSQPRCESPLVGYPARTAI